MLLTYIEQNLSFTPEYVKRRGKLFKQPKRTCWLGPVETKYCSTKFSPVTLDKFPPITELIDSVNDHCIKSGLFADSEAYNSCTVDWLDNNQDHIDWYYCTGSEFGPNPHTTTIILGDTRRVDIAQKGTKKKVKSVTSISCNDGTMYHMAAGCHDSLMYKVPRDKTRHRDKCIMLTFKKCILPRSSPAKVSPVLPTLPKSPSGLTNENKTTSCKEVTLDPQSTRTASETPISSSTNSAPVAEPPNSAPTLPKIVLPTSDDICIVVDNLQNELLQLRNEHNALNTTTELILEDKDLNIRNNSQITKAEDRLNSFDKRLGFLETSVNGIRNDLQSLIDNVSIYVNNSQSRSNALDGYINICNEKIESLSQRSFTSFSVCENKFTEISNQMSNHSDLLDELSQRPAPNTQNVSSSNNEPVNTSHNWSPPIQTYTSRSTDATHQRPNVPAGYNSKSRKVNHDLYSDTVAGPSASSLETRDIQSPKNVNATNMNEIPGNERKKRTLIVHDSLLRDFDPDKSDFRLDVETINVGSIEEALKPNTFRRIISTEQIDCYVIQLGVNDLKHHSPELVLDNMWQLINRISERSTANIVINCVLSVLNNKDFLIKILKFNDLLYDFISLLRKRNHFQNKLFTVFHRNFLNEARSDINSIRPLFLDGIHLNPRERGVKMFCANITRTVLASFGLIKYTPHHIKRGGSSYRTSIS